MKGRAAERGGKFGEMSGEEKRRWEEGKAEETFGVF